MKNPYREASRLTVMILGGLGKVRDFSISYHVFFGASLFFLCFTIVSVMAINAYFSERRTNRAQFERLKELQREIEMTKRALYRSHQHLAVLEEHIRGSAAASKTSAGVEASDEMTGAPNNAANEGQSREASEEETRKPQVDIQDMSMEKEGSRLMVSFKVVNTLGDETPVSGYVHIIAVNKKSEPPQLLPYPKVALRDGVPVNYNDGQFFTIKRFKTIQGEYHLNTDDELPSTMKVYVYDSQGALILEEKFDVESVS
jgi:hypothetical protein